MEYGAYSNAFLAVWIPASVSDLPGVARRTATFPRPSFCNLGCRKGTQRAQYDFIDEYTLNYLGGPEYDLRYVNWHKYIHTRFKKHCYLEKMHILVSNYRVSE